MWKLKRPATFRTENAAGLLTGPPVTYPAGTPVVVLSEHATTYRPYIRPFDRPDLRCWSNYYDLH